MFALIFMLICDFGSDVVNVIIFEMLVLFTVYNLIDIIEFCLPILMLGLAIKLLSILHYYIGLQWIIPPLICFKLILSYMKSKQKVNKTSVKIWLNGNGKIKKVSKHSPK